MGIHLPANGGDVDKSAEAIPAARRLPLRPPRLWRAGLRHQRDAGTRRGVNGRDHNSIHTFKQPCRGVKKEHGSFLLNRPWRVDSKFGDTATKLLSASNGSIPINICCNLCGFTDRSLTIAIETSQAAQMAAATA